MSRLNRSRLDEFYVGYAKIPRGVVRFLQILIPLLIVFYLGMAILAPTLHFDQFNLGKLGKNRDFEGLLRRDPSPHLMVPRPGDVGEESAYSVYLLTGTGKTSPKPKVMEPVDQWVTLSGLPVYRNNLTVIAARSAEPIERPETAAPELEMGTSLGQFFLTGEILDSKCYPGVMKPGRTKTHRACAIRCLGGGVPPIFRVENRSGDPLYFLLAGLEGKAVNEEVLKLVADPLRITGDVIRYGDTYVLKADPATYERV